jgi:hypothetical protein
MRRGIPHVARFTNMVSPNSTFFPPAGPGNAGSEGEFPPTALTVAA